MGTLIKKESTESEEKLKFLTKREYKTLCSLANIIIPEGGGIKYSGKDLQTVKNIDIFLSKAGVSLQGSIRMLLFIIEFGTNIFCRPFSRFTGLSEKEQMKYLKGFEFSRLAIRRMIFSGLRIIVMQGFYFNEEVWPEIKYAGPWARDIEEW